MTERADPFRRYDPPMNRYPPHGVSSRGPGAGPPWGPAPGSPSGSRVVPLLGGRPARAALWKALLLAPTALVVSLVPAVALRGGAAPAVAGAAAILFGLPVLLYSIAWISRALEGRACALEIDARGVRVRGGALDGRTFGWHELSAPGLHLDETPVKRFRFWRVWAAVVIGSICALVLVVAAFAGGDWGSGGNSNVGSFWSLRRPTPSAKVWLTRGLAPPVVVASTSDPEEIAALRLAVAALLTAR